VEGGLCSCVGSYVQGRKNSLAAKSAQRILLLEGTQARYRGDDFCMLTASFNLLSLLEYSSITARQYDKVFSSSNLSCLAQKQGRA